MKKGLLSILAGALVVVGCQNYDDQFDNLESQISALASTVAGLSQVQSDLSSLAGTVSSLASTVNGLGAQIDTAVADGLADIQADIDAITTAVDDVASSEEVSALSDAVAASQDDLDELLANSSVFNNSITINSQQTADVYAAMGSSINIVNGSVDITVYEDMDQAVVQTVVDNILNITGDFTYTAMASTIAETTFNNLSGVGSITAKQGGGYEFKALTSAGNIVLNNDYKSTVDIIHFGALTTVNTISDDGGTAGTIAFDKADEFHLTSLTRYPGNNLNIEIKKGGVLAMGVLTDNQADGTAVGSGYTLTVKGPAALDISTISDGTITVEDVETLTVSGFIGNLDVNSGVEVLTVTDIVDIDLAGADDLVTATIDGALDSDTNLTTADGAGPAITFASQDLTSATITGITGDINATSQANLETLVISAEIKNGTVAAPTSGTITVSGNNDLVTLTLTGAKAANVIVNANTDLETVTIDHTTTLKGTDTGGNIDVTGNTNLTSLTISANTVDDLNISGNTQLTTIAAGDLTVASATSATVLVKSNNFTASKAADSYDAAAATTDTGNYTSSSGLKTLKTYLVDALAATTTDIEVYYDTVELVQTQSSATATFADAAHTDAYTSTEENAIAYSKTTAASGRDTFQTVSVAFPLNRNAFGVVTDNLVGEGITLTNAVGSYNVVAPTGGQTVAELVAALDGNTNLGSGTTVTAARDSYNEAEYTISWTTSDSGVAATASAAGSVYFTYGTDPETGATISGTTANIAASGTDGAIGKAIATKFNSVQSAYVATATENKILITALVSGTINEDRGPLSHPLNTLSIGTTVAQASATLLWAGDAENLDSNASSNLTAAASSLYNLGIAKVTRTGLRVTLRNNSTAVADASLAAAEVASGDAMTGVGVVLAAGSNIIGSATNSSTLDYVASFAQVESQTAASTTSVDRTGWL
jgi:hypothetical protein